MESQGIEKRLRDLFGELEDRGGERVVCAYLFGSVARNEGRFEDVDVAVLYEREPEASIVSPHFALARRLERALGLPVDLIDLARAPPDLAHRVLRDGKLLVDRDPARRIRFEVRSRNEYFDMEPVWNEYRRLGRSRK